jgi:hypothetical protein
MNENPHSIERDAAGAGSIDQELQSNKPPLNGQRHEHANGTNFAKIRAHVEMLHRFAQPLRGRGKLIVASYGQSPGTGDDIPPTVLHYQIGEIEPMVTQIERLSREQHRNVYIPLAVFDPDLPRGRKGTEQQIIASLGLVADFDDDNAANYARRMPIAANYVVETSTGRFQAFLVFNQPIDPRRAKHVAELLKNFTGCDHGTADISHVWRVPGTYNWPNKKKVAQGRSATPQTVEVVQSWNGSLTDVETLEAGLNASEKTENKGDESKGEERKTNGNGGGGEYHDESDIPPELLKLIRDGVEQGRRSHEFFRAVAELNALGWAIDEITALFEKYPNGIAAKYVGRIREEVERAYKKVDDQEPAYKGHAHGGASGGQTQQGVSLDDFHAYMPNHKYMFAPSRELWPAGSVNARIPPVPIFDAQGKPVPDKAGNQTRLSASTWLDQNRAVEQMTWAPGLPMLIPNRLISEGGWIDRTGVTCFNLYRPPSLLPGNAAEVGPWLDHIYKVFGDDDKHIIKWLAHRVQCPEQKINHALVLGGSPGIGKDTLLEPVKYAVGPWNFIEVSPQQVLGRFNGFLKCTILRVSEARDLGDSDRFKFYDHMKAYTAAPPDVLRVDEKNLREYSIFNCCGVIIPTNYKADGIYLPADDRRHYVAWSDLTKEDFVRDYWNTLWGWYAHGGIWHVVAYLAELDIASFDPKAPPPKTQAFWDIVDAHRVPEDAELADVLDKMDNPDTATLTEISAAALQLQGNFWEWIKERKNRRIIPHRLEKCGYVPVRNRDANDGLWKINGSRQVIYAKSTLSVRERHTAAKKLMKASNGPATNQAPPFSSPW